MTRRPKKTGQTAAAPAGLGTDAQVMIATAQNDITIPFFSGVLQYVDDTLIRRGGGKGLKIYDEIERDTHAFAMLQKRKKTLISRDWTVKPASEAALDVAAADFVRERLSELPFDQVCEDLLDAILKGFAISEVVWARDGKAIVPAKIKSHDQRRFMFGEDWQPRLLTWTDMTAGIVLPARKFIVHRFGVKGNNPYGLGLGTRLFWPVLFKREGITFWLHFMEKFAGPTVIGKVPYGMPAEQQREFLRGLERVRTRAAITAPIGADISFLEAARSGSVTYQDFLAYFDKEIALTVTGETLTSDVGNSGSRALGDVHESQLEQLADSDGDLLAITLREQLLQWMVDYNLPGAAAPWIYRDRPEDASGAADVKKKRGDAAASVDAALRSVLATAATIPDDAAARDYVVAFGLTDELTDATIDALVAARFTIADERAMPPGTPPAVTAFSAMGDGLKKKVMTTSASAR